MCPVYLTDKKNCYHCSFNQLIAQSAPEAFTFKLRAHWSVSKKIIALQKRCRNHTKCSLCLFPECSRHRWAAAELTPSPAANIRGKIEMAWRGVAPPPIAGLPLCSLSHRRSAVTLVIIICSSGWKREEGEKSDCHREKGWRGRAAAINI